MRVWTRRGFTLKVELRGFRSRRYGRDPDFTSGGFGEFSKHGFGEHPEGVLRGTHPQGGGGRKFKTGLRKTALSVNLSYFLP